MPNFYFWTNGLIAICCVQSAVSLIVILCMETRLWRSRVPPLGSVLQTTSFCFFVCLELCKCQVPCMSSRLSGKHSSSYRLSLLKKPGVSPMPTYHSLVPICELQPGRSSGNGNTSAFQQAMLEHHPFAARGRPGQENKTNLVN